jgi:hypothetical protein
VYKHEVQERIPPGERLRVAAVVAWQNRWNLLGTAGSWFLLDVLFYGNSLFSQDIADAMNAGTSCAWGGWPTDTSGEPSLGGGGRRGKVGGCAEGRVFCALLVGAWQCKTRR